MKKIAVLVISIIFYAFSATTAYAQTTQTAKQNVTIENIAPGGKTVSISEQESNATLKIAINRSLQVNDKDKYVDVTLTVRMLPNTATTPRTSGSGTPNIASNPSTGASTMPISLFWALLLGSGTALVLLRKKLKKGGSMLCIFVLLAGMLSLAPTTALAQSAEPDHYVDEILSDNMLKSFSFNKIIRHDGAVDYVKEGDVVTGFTWHVNDLTWKEQRFIYRMDLKDMVDNSELRQEIPVTDTSVLTYRNLESAPDSLQFPYIAPQLFAPGLQAPAYILRVEHYLWDGTDATPITTNEYPVSVGSTYQSADYALPNRSDLDYLDHDIIDWFAMPDVTSVAVVEGQEEYTLKLYYGQKAVFNVYTQRKEMALDGESAGQSQNLARIMSMPDATSFVMEYYGFTVYSATVPEAFAMNQTGYYVGQTVDLSTLNPPSVISHPEIETELAYNFYTWVRLHGNFRIVDPQPFARKLTASTNDFYIEYKSNDMVTVSG